MTQKSRTHYTFLDSLRSNFSPLRPLQLWLEAACEASLARDKYVMQSTQKAVEGATALSPLRYVVGHYLRRRDAVAEDLSLVF
jgi:hypothetical protein